MRQRVKPVSSSRSALFYRLGLYIGMVWVLQACGDASLNNPYPDQPARANILYSSFSARPKHLDPIQSYSSDEYLFIGQIYEPPLQYHYLKRPYELVPLTATQMPQRRYWDKQGQQLAGDIAPDKVAFTTFDIHIKPGIRYQPHPAFAKDAEGNYLYQDMSRADMDTIFRLADFKQQGTRELVAADYVYQIKRLAHPNVQSPIFGLMSKYIVGLKPYAQTLKHAYQAQLDRNPQDQYFDLRKYDFPGVALIDTYTYRIKIRGVYPQLLYWLAMPFFAPIPHEADHFYSQPGMKQKNISFDWYPVGTGAYMLTANNPNRLMMLERNPNFRGIPYPTEGSEEDRKNGLLDDAGKTMPFIDKVMYSLEKEGIPGWSKFLQGYYDASGILSDSFDQAIQFSSQGDASLTDSMEKKHIKLVTATMSSISYIGFNMLDPVVGGSGERARLLRQAISIAFDIEEMIAIFSNGRGVPAQGIIPPGIFGYEIGKQGINSYVYQWQKNKPQRKNIYEAKQLLAKAGYSNGVDEKTGKPLLLYFDTAGGGAEDKAYFDFLRKQFRKLDLELIIRNTDYNRFREKMLKGNAQIYRWGWNADYPDPENFLFLLYGPNGKARYQGENASNYNNPEFDKLFEKMKAMSNSKQRLAIIKRMTAIIRKDAPWLWGYFPQQYVLFHSWYFNVKPNLMAHNTLMYKRIDPDLRATLRNSGTSRFSGQLF